MNNYNDSAPKYFVGHQIRAPKILVIDENGQNRGILTLREGLQIAEAASLQLIQISPAHGNNTPTCKVLDFGKFKYEQSIKDKLLRKNQREAIVETKEIKLTPKTATHDLSVKAKKASEILQDGNRCKISIMFKGREINAQHIGQSTLQAFLDMVPEAIQLAPPSINGRDLSVVLEKSK